MTSDALLLLQGHWRFKWALKISFWGSPKFASDLTKLTLWGCRGWGDFNMKKSYQYKNSHYIMTQSHSRLIFIMGIPILARWHIYVSNDPQAPRPVMTTKNPVCVSKCGFATQRASHACSAHNWEHCRHYWPSVRQIRKPHTSSHLPLSSVLHM